MQRISGGQTTLAELVELECADAAHPEECVGKAQARRYQEQGRAKRRLEEAVSTLEAGGEPVEVIAALRAAVRSLPPRRRGP